MTTTLTLTIPKEYVPPPWLVREASPEQVATVLDVASKVYTVASQTSSMKDTLRCMIDDVLSNTRKDSIQQKCDALEERSNRLFADLQVKSHELDAMKSSVDAIVEQRVEQRSTQLAHECEDSKRRALMQQGNRVEDLAMTLEAERATARKELGALYDQLREQCARSGVHAREASEAQKLVASLQTRIAELETPTGKGRVGELNVTQAIVDAGFVVEDTSTGDRKNQGYLDLLLTQDCEEGTGGARIAVEVKNVAVVEARHLRDFERKVQEGIQKNLWDAAIFVSIRSHTKKDRQGSPVVLELFPDGGGRQLAPVTWIGCEKGKHAQALTSEQIETHVNMVFALLSRTQHLRDELSSGLTDGDITALQAMVDAMGSHFTHAFAELGKQHKLVQDMQQTLTETRKHCLRMFMVLWEANRDTTWLRRPIEDGFVQTVHAARDIIEKDAKLTDKGVLDVSSIRRSANALDRTVGKEALVQVARELKRTREDE